MSPLFQIFFSFLLAFVGIFLVSVTDYWYLSRTFSINDHDIAMLTAAYGASAVLLYDAYLSPLAQPRNVIGGYAVSSFVGVTVRIVCQHIPIDGWAVAVAFAIAVMALTKTVHPPGGGCSLVAVIGGASIHSLGYAYVLTSVGAAFIMVMVAWIGNNLIPDRVYPQYWY